MNVRTEYYEVASCAMSAGIVERSAHGVRVSFPQNAQVHIYRCSRCERIHVAGRQIYRAVHALTSSEHTTLTLLWNKPFVFLSAVRFRRRRIRPKVKKVISRACHAFRLVRRCVCECVCVHDFHAVGSSCEQTFYFVDGRFAFSVCKEVVFQTKIKIY